MSLRARVATVLLVVVGLINVLPGVVLFDPARSATLYGIALEGETLLVLMRHRALLLALLGAGLIAAAFRPAWRAPAIVAAVASKLVFIGLYANAAAPTAELGRVAAMDVLALALLAVAAWAGRHAAGT